MAGARYAQHGTVFEIELSHAGTRVIERRLGADVPSELQTYDTEHAALRAYHERTAELMETAWRRVSPCDGSLLPGVPAPDRDDELATLRAVRAADTDADHARSIYTDLLVERGDPCGELAALRQAAPTDTVRARITDLERERGVDLYGLLGVLGPAWWAQFELGWRGGWIDQVTARHRFMTDGRAMTATEAREALHQVLHAPMARFVRHLALDATFARGFADPSARTSGAPCRHVAEICELTLLEPAPPVDELVAALPGLTRMSLQGGMVSPGHPRVEQMAITVRTGANAWLTGEWPALRRLDITLATADRGPVGSVTKLLRARRLAGVTQLALGAERHLPTFFVEALVASPLLRTLEHLVIRAPLNPRLRAKLEAASATRGFTLDFGE